MLRGLIGIVLFSAVALAQDTPSVPKMEAKVQAVGDRLGVKIESVLELDLEITESTTGEAPKTRQLNLQRTDEFDQEVTSIEEGIRKERVICLSSKIQKSGTNQALTTGPTDINGKTFTIVHSVAARSIRMGEDLPPIDAAGICSWEEYTRLLPKGESKEGAVWNVDAAALTGLVSIADLASAAGTFEVKLEKFAEGKATITFTGFCTGKTTKAAAYKLNLTGGRLEFDAARGRPVSLSVAGALEVTQDIIQKVARPGSNSSPEDKVGQVLIKSRKLEVKVEFR